MSGAIDGGWQAEHAQDVVQESCNEEAFQAGDAGGGQEALMPPAVVDVMRRYQAQLLARESAQLAEMARRWIAIQDALEKTIQKLANEVAAAKQAGQIASPAMLGRMARYQELLMQLRAEIARYVNGYAVPRIEAEQLSLLGLAGDQATAALEAMIGLRFNRLPIEAMLDMVGLTSSGSPLSDLLMQAWPDAIEGLTQALIDGTTLGWNPRKTARAMRQGIDQGLERMIRIARTEQLRVYRQANLENYRQSGVVRGYRRLAARQLRTCLACILDDGHFYKLSQEFGDHVQGRCTLVPVVIGAPEVRWPSGKTWFKGLSEPDQQQIMGPGAWQAWQSGQIKLEDLLERTMDPTWGASVQVRSLKEVLGA